MCRRGEKDSRAVYTDLATAAERNAVSRGHNRTDRGRPKVTVIRRPETPPSDYALAVCRGFWHLPLSELPVPND